MLVFSIGRDLGQDIVLDEPTVSRFHAELVVAHNDLFYLTDCKSSLGTRVARDGGWIEVKQDFVKKSDKLLLGRHQIEVSDLLRLAAVRV